MKDYVEYCSSVVHQVPIAQDLLASASCGKQKYMLYLKEQQEEKERHANDEKKGKLEKNLEIEEKKRNIC